MKMRPLNLGLLILFTALLTALAVVPVFAQDSASAAFPATIEHKFGSTTITQPPQRVVAIGYTEQDYLFALGVTPLAVRSWYADESIAYLPWAEDEANGATPQVLVMPFGNLNYEAILALDPDLISAVTAGITQEEYDILSQIAPTLAQSGDYIDFGMPWQAITRTIGAAVGQAEEAEALVANVEGLFAEARAQNPQFEGKTVAVAYNYGEARTYGYYTAQDGRGRFFTDLGFVVPDELNEIAGESFYADISAERIDLLDQDVLVFLGLSFAEGGPAAIEADPLISQLDAFQDGRVVFIPSEYDDALQYSSVLSLEYALEGIVPELAAAVDAAANTDAVSAQDTNDCEEGFRLVEHHLGETCVPEGVQRVVALEWTYVEDLLALGMQPVGVADIAGYEVWVDLPITLDDSVADVGTRQEPNLERIAELDPDLILTASFRATNNYDELSAIAPTLAFDPYPSGDGSHYEEMLTAFMTIAEVLNLEENGQQVLDELEAHFAQAEAALHLAGRDNETFILAQGWVASDAATFRLFTDNAMAVQILEQIGLENAWDDAPQLYGFTEIGFEGFSQVEDTNFFYIAQDDANQVFADSPLWNGLPFVQSGRAYWLGGDVWLFGGPLSAELLVDTILGVMGVEVPQAETASVPTNDDCEAGFRLVEHHLGEICIPQNPQGIAAVDLDVLAFRPLLNFQAVTHATTP